MKKCQSLTRNHSAPNPLPLPHNNGIPLSPISRQKSCPESNLTSTPLKPPTLKPKPPSPIVPPKPANLAKRNNNQLDVLNGPKVIHLPPSGVKKLNGTTKSNANFISDLEKVMSERGRSNRELSAERPFPNRFSSGEYENANAVNENKMAPNAQSWKRS